MDIRPVIQGKDIFVAQASCLRHFLEADMKKNIGYRIIRSDRQTIAIQISPEGEVLVRCPRRMREDAIRTFVASKSHWIETHLTIKNEAPKLPEFAPEELRALAQQAVKMIPERVAYFAPLVGVPYGRITIRNQRSRWGSCSGKGNLNFNCLLILVPQEVMDYVVVHELCHRIEMNHSLKFWAEVERVLPDYRERQKWLRENGPALIGRLPR